jgi:hypothetical protein
MGKPFMAGYRTYDTSNGHGNPKDWRKAFNQRISPEEAEQILKEQNDTPENLLGLVAGKYTLKQLTTAYRDKMKEWHPDLNPHREDEATEMCKKINAAYVYLKSRL